MIQTINFKTRDRIVNRNFPCPEGFWVCGIDIGYGGIKGFSPNKYFSISSYTYRLPRGAADSRPAGVKPTDIVYRDKDGDWAVGDFAYNMENPNNPKTLDTKKTAKENRYLDKDFKIFFAVAMGLALLDNKERARAGEKIMVQTGLPTAYLEQGHARYLRSGIEGDYDFDLKVGNEDYVHFEFTLTKEQVSIISQPQGALYSACKDINGNDIETGKEYMGRHTLVIDPGFLTTDFNGFNNGVPVESGSLELGMHEVFQRAINEILREHGVSVTNVEFRQALTNGMLEVYDYITNTHNDINITSFLEEANKSVCEEVMDKIMTSFQGLSRHDYLLVAGGTGAAWMPYSTDRLKNHRLEIVRCNQNDQSLNNVYSTARGYYFWIVDRLTAM